MGLMDRLRLTLSCKMEWRNLLKLHVCWTLRHLCLLSALLLKLSRVHSAGRGMISEVPDPWLQVAASMLALQGESSLKDAYSPWKLFSELPEELHLQVMQAQRPMEDMEGYFYVMAPQLFSVDWQKLNASSLAAQTIAMIDAFGFAMLPEVVPRALCEELAAVPHLFIHDQKDMPGHIFKNVGELTDENGVRRRFDEPLPLDEPDAPAAHALRVALTLLGDIYERLLGAEAKLVEFATLTPYPGAMEQQAHPDYTNHEGSRENFRFITTFLYSVDVVEHGGALDIWPGTHHDRFHRSKQGLPSTAVRIVAPAGSLVLYDARLVHRGSAYSDDAAHLQCLRDSCSREQGAESGDSRIIERTTGRVSLYWTFLPHGRCNRSLAMILTTASSFSAAYRSPYCSDTVILSLSRLRAWGGFQLTVPCCQ